MSGLARRWFGILRAALPAGQAFALGEPEAADGGVIKVVVPASCQKGSISREELSRLFLRDHPSAIGYVSKDAPAPGVRVLQVRP